MTRKCKTCNGTTTIPTDRSDFDMCPDCNSPKMEDWTDSRGNVHSIHAKDTCEGEHCPFHNPSDHPLKDAPIHIRYDKGALVERICEHGVGHDDPDSVAYFHKNGQKWAGVHGCDGCCTKEGNYDRKDSRCEGDG